MLVLSYKEAKVLLDAARLDKPVINCSLNLGKTTGDVIITRNESNKFDFLFQGDKHLNFEQIKKITETEGVCFLIEDNNPIKIQLFSPDTNLFYKLLPTSDWPTLEISGVRMHRVTQVTPKKDTEMKIELIKPVTGKCLDTCCGLGYTAIGMMYAGASEVVTIEKDPNCLEICRHNPWSQELFHSKAITVLEGDVFEKIKKMKSNSFDRIIHDPPSFALAGPLYSLEFYGELYRILKKDGKLYHYTGRPGAVRSNRDLIGDTVKRFKQIRFREIARQDKTLGVSCIK